MPRKQVSALGGEEMAKKAIRRSIHILDWIIRIICLCGLVITAFLYRHTSFIDLYNTTDATKSIIEFTPYAVYIVGLVSTFIYEKYYLYLIACLYALLGMLALIVPPLASLWAFYLLWFMRLFSLNRIGPKSRVSHGQEWWFEKEEG